ncbi:MAG: endonuclease/exonuclease/phosphatase family protein [Rhodothermales bacterium]|nr:endonuclease/exonuclease/phosphatase family protein [Rhodothermales bacterium]
MFRVKFFLPVLFIVACADRGAQQSEADEGPVVLRIMEFNVEDVRTTDLLDPEHPRLVQAASIIQSLRPDILMLSEVAYDYEGVTGYDERVGEGANGLRLTRDFLSRSQSEGLSPIQYQYFAAPTNTGVSSGLDLDNSGAAVTVFPAPQASNEAGEPPRQTAAERSYGNDAWGFGTFPGQYGMLLLVRDGIEIQREDIRTFQLFPWSTMPGALIPADESGKHWYSDEEWRLLRLSSKSHWDVPVKLENGSIIHLLLSHPTPPAFDGPEGRNKKRNHDEIRFWGDYIDGADYIVDDTGRSGGLEPTSHFVIMGDLNADLDEGSSIDDPVGRFLVSSERVNGDVSPAADSAGQARYERLDPDDTAQWGLRVDYVLPSSKLKVIDSGVYRPDAYVVSDHFPVWIDVEVDQ